ncbi:MAG: PSD1 and planctomycete cytochrome C domain-containing protein [Isosphaeraceae bacterium]|nr:PSD1 and planctomycete cytochrome C domain-containing protein [Isosphaeraceae bacterium]
MNTLRISACALALSVAHVSSFSPCAADDRADFDRGVAPILNRRCLECHDAANKSGGLDLTSAAGLIAGGEGGPVVEPGEPGESRLIERIVAGEMPPKRGGKPVVLDPTEIDALRAWIASGARWPAGRILDPFESTTAGRAGRDWWSLQPVVDHPAPAARSGSSPANWIDAFIDQRLSEAKMLPAPEADRRALIRRVYHDVIGLLPSYDEVEAFANDERVDAYERLVDRLLASPRFGERWARRWLDVVRFAETSGYERDQVKPNVWRYRDWVISALNRDLPLDRFVIEQLAGDELPDRDESTLIATGFIRLGTWNDEPNDPGEYVYERLEDMVHATTTAFLGLTVKCARCHDHKFDPIRQSDYYRIASAFWAGPIEPGPREHLGGPAPEATPGIFAWTDRGRVVPPFRLLKKGDPRRPGEVVEPGPLSCLPSIDRAFDPPPADSATTRRRLQLAHWIVDSKNPLTSRVWVNRIWSHYFGEGLVRSPDNFGFNGDRPTHPELLDRLASELGRSGGRSKPIHRAILLSATYRQSTIHPDRSNYERIDAGNLRLWHAPRKRLDSEALRDALLAASGRLRLGRIGGPSFAPEISAEALEGLSMKSGAWRPSPPDEQLRRAIYAFTKRGLALPMATTFDQPDSTLPCGRRDVTIVAPQALTLFNNAFVHEQSRMIGTSAANAATSDAEAVRLVWRRVLARDPTDGELRICEERLAEIAGSRQADRAAKATSLAHILLNTNEFISID